jgi:hypothetical protein
MEAVAALYGPGATEQAEAIVRSLGRTVFGAHGLDPAGAARRLLARLSYRIVKRTTRRAPDGAPTTYLSPILERSGHPYAQSLLSPSRQDIAGLVEGGDPMNGPYMMIVPEIRQAGDRWDRLFFNSVQGRDVQLRFIWETLATHADATQRLKDGQPVRLKAVAAGTGLSAVLAYDQLIQDGHDPDAISLSITDREDANSEKTRRLLDKLSTTRGRIADSPAPGAIAVFSEDAFSPVHTTPEAYDIITAVGIFEYLAGHTCETTEQRHGLPTPDDEPEAAHLASGLATITAPGGSLIVNTYRPHSSIRLLEVFGKKFDYRTRENLSRLLGTAGLRPDRLVGSGTIYDVEVYQKHLP